MPVWRNIGVRSQPAGRTHRERLSETSECTADAKPTDGAQSPASCPGERGLGKPPLGTTCGGFVENS